MNKWLPSLIAAGAAAIVVFVVTVGPGFGKNRERKIAEELALRFPIFQKDLPFTIEQSGTYYVAERLRWKVECGDCAITIDASNVALDLNGFTLSETRIQNGPTVPTGIEIRNGFISGGDCIQLPEINGVVVKQLRVESCSGDGIAVGNRSLIVDTIVSSVDGTAFTVGTMSQIERSIANSSSAGFSLGNGSLATGCTSSGNSTTGFLLSDFTHLFDSTIVGSSFGVRVEGRRARVVNNMISASTSVGVQVEESASDITGNTMTRNRVGIRILAGERQTRIEDNLITAPSSGRADEGIVVEGFDNLIIGNRVLVNKGIALSVADGNYVGPTATAGNATSPVGNVVNREAQAFRRLTN